MGDFAIAATGKMQKQQDMACGVVGRGEHKHNQIGTDCKGISQWGTLEILLPLVFGVYLNEKGYEVS